MQRDIAREHVRGLGAQRSRAGSWRDSRAAGGAHSTQAPTLESTEQGTLGARAPSTEALALFPSIASSWLQNQGHSISDGKRLRARWRERRCSETTSMEFKCLGNTETAGGGFNEHFRFFLPQQDGAAWRLRWGPESGRNGAECWHRHLLALSIWEGFPGFRKTGSSTVFKSKRALPQTRLRRRSPGV